VPTIIKQDDTRRGFTIELILSHSLLVVLVVAAQHRHRQLLELFRAEWALGRRDLDAHTVLDQLALGLEREVLFPAQLGEACRAKRRGPTTSRSTRVAPLRSGLFSRGAADLCDRRREMTLRLPSYARSLPRTR
jgi:hypothetical protein